MPGGERNEKVARRMLTTEEAAACLGTTVRHLRRLVSDHELGRYKVGGRNRFADVDLDAWLEGRKVVAVRRSARVGASHGERVLESGAGRSTTGPASRFVPRKGTARALAPRSADLRNRVGSGTEGG